MKTSIRGGAIAGLLAATVLWASVAAAQSGPVMRVLVTNDDGIGAEGISELVEHLAAIRGLQVEVIAPATNQSGTGDNFTTGPIEVFAARTAGGYAGRAVRGFPADTVLFGVQSGTSPRPDLVVSGINEGQNVAEAIDISGTVGAAVTAARLGIPAIAVSQGFGAGPLNYGPAAEYTAQLVEKFRVSKGFRAKLTTRYGTRAALVLNVNFPTCTAGSVRGIQLVPLGRITRTTGYTLQSTTGQTQRWAPQRTSISLASNCLSTAVDPVTDAEAMAIGYATITPLNSDLTTSQKLRSFRFLLRP